MMRNPPPANTDNDGAQPSSSSSLARTWMGNKENGKRYFQNQEYDLALASYRAALNPEFSCPAVERQVLLSNIVACRLKIGGAVQAAAAVEEAKQCIALNESWAKGHVRLASAYIALGDHSNDACNALQRALSLDPGNANARQMLMRELRRDHHLASSSRQRQQQAAAAATRSATNSSTTTSSSNSSSSSTTTPTAPPEHEVVHDDQSRTTALEDTDDSLSWLDYAKMYYHQALTWYYSLSDDKRNLLKVALVLLSLYVAFGGRFGLDQVATSTTASSSNSRRAGHYEAGNAYDRYYKHHAHSSSSNHRYDPSDYDYNYDRPHHHGHERRSSSRGSSWSFHFPNLMDGSPQSMLCLAGILYLCYRNGINPFQVIFMMNMMAGNRRGGMRRGYGMGYGGGGLGGMGGGGLGGFGRGRNRWR